MRKLYLVIVAIILGIIYTSCKEQQIGSPQNELPAYEKAEYSNPGCVIGDSTGEFFYVSNRSSGEILKINRAEELIETYDGFIQPKGILISNGLMYIVEDAQIKVLDLEKKDVIKTFVIQGAKYLNGIAEDDHGFLYITDTHTGYIYKLNTISDNFEIISKNDIKYPIGICYVSGGFLMIASGSKKANIYRIDLSNNKPELIVNSDKDYFDFITPDGNGDFFVSCWGDHSIYLLRNNTNSVLQLYSTDHNGPAGLFYSIISEELIVPNFESNTLSFLSRKYFKSGPELVDIDSNHYRTIKINDKLWLAENFKAQHNSEGVELATANVYDNDEIYLNKHGRLYSLGDAINAAPTGWSLPTDNDWKELEMALGMSKQEADKNGWRGDNETFLMIANNAVGFHATMAGYFRDSENEYRGEGIHASYWTSTSYNSLEAWGRELFFDNGQVSRQPHPINFRFSVRYIKGN